MNAEKCLQILREIKDVSFATVDKNGNPQNRIIDIMLVEQDAFYFVTARGKHFYKELEYSNQVAIAALTKNYEMIRLNGTAIKLKEQEKWLTRIFEKNPSMDYVYPKESRFILEPYCVKDAQIEYFDLRTNPIFRETYIIGNWVPSEKGFYISAACIACDKCASVCPQSCISKGKSYKINQANCLHCGLCYEACPVNAVKKKGEAIL